MDGTLRTGLYTETAGTALIGVRRICDHSPMNTTFDLSDKGELTIVSTVDLSPFPVISIPFI
ncbi:hypothetical protein AA0498_2013 [Acidomonas methanolica]|nr:hypothetical protein AA0498_2013 [Acidomonas methanolica]